MYCENAQVTLSTDPQGRDWEHFWLGQVYQFSNQIPNRRSFTTTNPGHVIANRGLCVWQSHPPTADGLFTAAPSAMPSTAVPAMTTDTAGGEGAIGLLLVLGLAGSAVWAWFNKGKDDFADDYHPMSDSPGLPPAYIDGPTQTQGHSPIETPNEFEPEFDGHSSDFEGSYEPSPTELPSELPSPTWPPKSMGAPYDPLQPEQAGEFASFRKAIENDGLSPKGNDVLRLLWGVTPGRSRAYLTARKRRDDFANRLDYYRYEEAQP